MGCNGWNHPLDCNCGWGGDTGGRGGGGGHTWTRDLPLSKQSTGWSNDCIRGRIEGFTIPNAHCPVCGAPVFFYQSPFGGRVFFDELGPPWPKHPCTDNSGHVLRLTRDTTSTLVRNKPEWQNAGWTPLLFANVTKQADRLVISGDVDLRGTRIELIDTRPLDAAGPIFLRPRQAMPGLYDVSALTSDSLSLTARTRLGVEEFLSQFSRQRLIAAAADDPAALLELAQHLLFEVGLPHVARPYLERALTKGCRDALFDLVALALFPI